jgi:hypothetical protein
MGDNQIDFTAYFTDPNYSLPDFASSQPSASGLIDSLSSTIGKVADFGFNVQKQQLQVQQSAQDNQLKALMSTLGFKTAVTQANAQSQIAQYQAQGAVAQAAKAAGVGQPAGISTTMLLLIGIGAYVLVNRK